MALIIGTDYRKRERDALRIGLPGHPGKDDADGFEIDILPPTKGIYEKVAALAGAIDDVAEDPGTGLDMGLALDTVAAAMSRNAEGRAITPAYLDAIGFDILDIGDFCAMYVIFLQKLVEAKN